MTAGELDIAWLYQGSGAPGVDELIGSVEQNTGFKLRPEYVLTFPVLAINASAEPEAALEYATTVQSLLNNEIYPYEGEITYDISEVLRPEADSDPVEFYPYPGFLAIQSGEQTLIIHVNEKADVITPEATSRAIDAVNQVLLVTDQNQLPKLVLPPAANVTY